MESPPAKRSKTDEGEEGGSFESILRCGGLVFEAGQPPVCGEPNRLRRHVEKALRANGQKIASFSCGMSAFIDVNLSLALAPLRAGGALGGGSRSSAPIITVKPSLVRLLLGVDSLQVKLAKYLLEKLPTLADEGGHCARQVLNQLRWLDYLVDARALSTSLLSVMDTCEVELKRDIITSIPEIIGDARIEVSKRFASFSFYIHDMC
jgi:Fanconi anemia group D2 protein